MLQIGQIAEVRITDVNHMGKGVGKINDFVVFIDNTISGDYVQIQIFDVKKNYAEGKLIKIIEKSTDRIESPCSFYHQCGGCQLMHMRYEQQLIYKKNRVINELRRAGVNLEGINIYDTIGMDTPFRYRNKTAFFTAQKDKTIIMGPYEQGTYNTVNISNCLLQSEAADKAFGVIRKAIAKYNIAAYDKKTGNGFIRSIIIRSNKKNELMIIIVTSKESFPNKQELTAALTSEIIGLKTIVQNINNKPTNLIMGDKNITLFGEGVIEDTIGDLIFKISPETFFQINPVQTEKLYSKAIEYADLTGDNICFDLYCGIGTISLMASRSAKKVYGVEIVEQSIINAKENAAINKIKNVEFYAGKTEKLLPKLYNQGIKADVIILDPPRKGCERAVIDTIIDMSPKKIVYVSCNPQTLARDIKLLETAGYRPEKVQPVDQFPWTVHVECVILMQNCGIAGKK